MMRNKIEEEKELYKRINKDYYIPFLDEICINFEYELREIKDNKEEWIKINDFTNAYEYEDSCFYGYYKDWNNGKIRVKYLDKQDIEELGFKPSPDEPEEWFLWKDSYDSYQLYFDDKTRDELKNMGIGITIYDKDSSDRIFNGYIKNKSELKKLMKQLDIV